MQATLRHTFIPEITKSSRTLTPDERNQYGIFADGDVLFSKSAETTCCSTAYEVLRRSSGPTLDYPVHNLMPQEVDLRLTDRQLSKSFLGDSWAVKKNRQPHSMIRPFGREHHFLHKNIRFFLSSLPAVNLYRMYDFTPGLHRSISIFFSSNFRQSFR